MQTLGALKPAFKEMGEGMPGFDKIALMKYPHLERINHIHHAGNSSGIVDGAAAILIGDAEFGRIHGLKPRARIRATAKIGTDPTIMLTGPVPVTERILATSGLTIADIDLFEVNEAFAAVVLRFMQAFAVDPARVNVNGGAIAMGHPLGATGAMILGTLLDEMERQDLTLGLATLCVASGMGAATIIAVCVAHAGAAGRRGLADQGIRKLVRASELDDRAWHGDPGWPVRNASGGRHWCQNLI
jgi:acetyl-CoA C-acetyltransferase